MMTPTPATGPPQSTAELMARAQALAGRTLGELAEGAGLEAPENLKRNKGWVGQLLEAYLGATAGNQAAPDFVELDIELKTLPVDATGQPLETTYVCTVPLTEVEDLEWDDSWVKHKLNRVLWVPIHAERHIPIKWRMIGSPVLWTPDPEEEALLRRDWEGHVHTIRDGYVENIRGKDGVVLQIRPKAADASALTWSIDERGEAIMTLPRGFYLRKAFTARILARYFSGDLPENE